MNVCCMYIILLTGVDTSSLASHPGSEGFISCVGHFAISSLCNCTGVNIRSDDWQCSKNLDLSFRELSRLMQFGMLTTPDDRCEYLAGAIQGFNTRKLNIVKYGKLII